MFFFVRHTISFWPIIIIFALISCSVPNSLPDDPSATVPNNPPWPITGPISEQPLTSASRSFPLEIRDDLNNLLSGNENFDPDDNDLVTFQIVRESLSDLTVIPDVYVTEDGIFTINWDDYFTGKFITAVYTITTFDGEEATPPTTTIKVVFP